MQKLVFALVALALLAAGYWLYTAPQRAWRDLKQAADKGDELAVYERLDTVAVKQRIREQLTAAIRKDLASRGLRDIPARFVDKPGPVPVSYVVKLQVERAMQPQSLVALLQGDTAHSLTQGDELTTTDRAGRTWADTVAISGSYDSVSRYTVHVADKRTHRQVVAMTMHRERLTWKLVAVLLPLGREME